MPCLDRLPHPYVPQPHELFLTARARALAVLLLLAAVACSTDGAPPGSAPPAPPEAPASPPPIELADPERYAAIACSLPRDQIRRVYNGYHPVRSGEIQFVPEEPNYVGNFSSHSGPWDYLARVPLFLYGPGHVPEVGEVRRPVTVADIAPTFAEYLDFDFDAPDGRPLREAIDPGSDPPKLIVTMVWDGGGRNVMDEYPDAWPIVRSLIPEGAWYDRAEVGSSPSVTPAIHSSIGTGAFPRNHGIVDLRFRLEGLVDPGAYQRATLLIGPSLADEYDLALDNEPVIGMVGSEGTLGMIGHGSLWEGGDMDLAGAQRSGEWGLAATNQMHYSLPSYIPEHPGYDDVEPNADREDGNLDGRWFGLRLDNPDSLTHTGSYSAYQTDVIETIIEREGFGEDRVTDLLYVNYKQIDKVGHKFAFPTEQMELAVGASDREFGALIELLDREVGRGEWVIALTADHGSTPIPETTGAFVIDNFRLQSDLQATFDGDGDGRNVFQKPRVTQSWIDLEELAERGHTLEEIADYLMAYTRADNAAEDAAVLPDNPDETVFAAAFPSVVMEDLPCLRQKP